VRSIDNGTPARVPDEWYVGFHTGLAARFWRAAGATMAEADAEVVRRVLDRGPAGRVLDVPCGDGRMSLRLAAAGHDVVGVDLAPAEVEHAAAAAAGRGLRARFLVGDLRDLPDVGPVDVVLSWGNSFGYLLPADSAASLAGMRRRLGPGGRLVLESMTVAEALLPGGLSGEAETYAFGGIRMTTEDHYRAAESRLETRATFEADDGTVETAVFAHHVHTSGEVTRMLHAAGFGDVELLGSDGEQPFTVGSPKLIAVATV
jgi:cyclopropane fatty-acyl-phospholipid synthase-like methyltransferase